MNQICLQCKKQFYIFPSRMKRGRGKYCSKLCSNLGKKGKNCSPHSQFKSGLVPWNKGRPMSQESKQKMVATIKKIMPLKKKVAYWKGKSLPFETRQKMSRSRKKLFSFSNKRARESFESAEWRKKIFERDNFTCQICFKTNCYLEADHIKPWAYFPELRFELNNGRTLCRECHRNTETYGGRVRTLYRHLRRKIN